MASLAMVRSKTRFIPARWAAQPSAGWTMPSLVRAGIRGASIHACGDPVTPLTSSVDIEDFTF
jgi:hypothetical protein